MNVYLLSVRLTSFISLLVKDDLANAARQKAEDVGGSVRIIHKKPKTSRDGQSPQESKSLQFTKSPVTGKKRKELPDEGTEESCERQEPKKKSRQDTESNQEMSKSGFVQVSQVWFWRSNVLRFPGCALLVNILCHTTTSTKSRRYSVTILCQVRSDLSKVSYF